MEINSTGTASNETVLSRTLQIPSTPITIGLTAGLIGVYCLLGILSSILNRDRFKDKRCDCDGCKYAEESTQNTTTGQANRQIKCTYL
ncbi:unnamed protein product [Bursaphelenchus xylophilus]|uniref:(pine wood nematode) hypothetical protein n=1 Tax=Bursaphelenchus xylophilus TaxID=6326 RepID=A0A1I7S0Z6_BURXY|nr:unnamed protein product [Bursaphelenchus xylophilus]CAG9087927.1 unnamed protein product [Bursaphelenchus xylophilus]